MLNPMTVEPEVDRLIVWNCGLDYGLRIRSVPNWPEYSGTRYSIS